MNNACRSDCDVSSRTNSGPDLGLRERRGVIYAVANHRNFLALVLQLFNLRGLIFRADLGKVPVDRQFVRYCPCDIFPVTRDETDGHLFAMKALNSLPGLRPDFVS